MVIKEFEPKFVNVSVLTASLQDLTPRRTRDKRDEAAACMLALQREVLPAQEIPAQGVGREAYRS